MASGWLLSVLAVGYLGCLFAIAFWGDRRAIYPGWSRLRPTIYGLALGIYCTSWTFYGAVGTAVREGWAYVPIYLGPALVFLFALPFLEKLVGLTRAHKVTSIADFIASRFGKSRPIAVLVTLIAFTAAVPYLALQYKAVAASIAVLTGTPPGVLPWYRDAACGVAVLMALFAVLFGARRFDASEHREGLMVAIAFESALKLLAFVGVGLYALWHLRDEPFALPPSLAGGGTLLTPDALTTTLLSAAAIVCLPRQFHVGIVECAQAGDLRHARWQLPLYLGLFSVFVIPIVALGMHVAGTGGGGPDTVILTLPMHYGAPWLAMLVFLGGLSASTAMVVVSSIALATMISNDIVVPLLWQRRLQTGASLGRRVLWLRRAVIAALALLGYSYYRSTAGSTSLASIGILAFAAVAQFAPGLLAALYWEGASRSGVFYGLLVGFAAWAYLLFLPNLVAGGPLDASQISAVGPGALIALACNVAVLLGVSLVRGVTLQERLAARAFMAPRRGGRSPAIAARVEELEAVAADVVGAPAARLAVAGYRAGTTQGETVGDRADQGLLQHFERLLTGSIGASSARIVLTHALARRGIDLGDVAELLDETSQELQFSRQLLQTTMENVTQGISVVDAQMRIVVWNRRYLEMFGYPAGMVQVGRPVADLIRWSAARGELGPGDPEQHVQKRIAHMRAGTVYTFQRVRPDGRVYSIHGQPMHGGGFVTTYSDITEFKRTEQALLDAKQGLEERVELRTRELRAAKQQAEAANVSKTRFVAAASHDLLQPLNAARLFASALETRAQGHPEIRELATRIDGSMRAAEDLLKDLLDVARLDTGVLEAEISVFPVGALLEDLRQQYAPVAAARGLSLVVVATAQTVRSDRTLLRRILQNYVSNALRYTERGGVLMGCRRRGGALEICVCDSGPGIAPQDQSRLYAEFSRRDHASPWGEKGVGLGLAICERLARLLGHELTLSSRPGHGAKFGVCVPREAPQPLGRADPLTDDPAQLDGLRVLCVDNDDAILDAMQALLAEWRVEVVRARSVEEARAALRGAPFHAVLADHHLGAGPDGLELLESLAGDRIAALITADRSPEVARRARTAGVPVLHKPLRPAALRALLAAARRRRARPAGESGAGGIAAQSTSSAGATS